MTVYYTVVASNEVCDEGIEQTIYKTTQLSNLNAILNEVDGYGYDHVDLTISDGEVPVTVEVAT
jgi:hypothetical protein